MPSKKLPSTSLFIIAPSLLLKEYFSKACTVYTTGYICAVLNISIDTVFGIENNFSSEEQAEFVNQLSQLKVDLRMKDQEIEHLHHEVDEEEKRLHQAHLKS